MMQISKAVAGLCLLAGVLGGTSAPGCDVGCDCWEPLGESTCAEPTVATSYINTGDDDITVSISEATQGSVSVELTSVSGYTDIKVFWFNLRNMEGALSCSDISVSLDDVKTVYTGDGAPPTVDVTVSGEGKPIDGDACLAEIPDAGIAAPCGAQPDCAISFTSETSDTYQLTAVSMTLAVEPATMAPTTAPGALGTMSPSMAPTLAPTIAPVAEPVSISMSYLLGELVGVSVNDTLGGYGVVGCGETIEANNYACSYQNSTDPDTYTCASDTDMITLDLSTQDSTVEGVVFESNKYGANITLTMSTTDDGVYDISIDSSDVTSQVTVTCPTPAPSSVPTPSPTLSPTMASTTMSPTVSVTPAPTVSPTSGPMSSGSSTESTDAPTTAPTMAPTLASTDAPTSTSSKSNNNRRTLMDANIQGEACYNACKAVNTFAYCGAKDLSNSSCGLSLTACLCGLEVGESPQGCELENEVCLKMVGLYTVTKDVDCSTLCGTDTPAPTPGPTLAPTPALMSEPTMGPSIAPSMAPTMSPAM